MHEKPAKKKKSRMWSTRFSTILSVSLVLFILGLAMLFAYHAYNFSGQVRENISFTVYFKSDIAEDAARDFEQKIQEDNRVKKTIFIDKDQAATLMSDLLGAEHLDIFEGQIPYDLSVEVYLYAKDLNKKEIANFISKIEQEPLVNFIDYRRDLIEDINKVIYNVGVSILVLFICLLFIAVTLINQTVRLSIYSSRFLIHTMELVGARRSTIRRPFLWLGFRVGLMGGLFAVISLGVLVFFTARSFGLEILHSDLCVYAIIASTLVIFGILLSFFCNLLAVYRYMRLKTDILYT